MILYAFGALTAGHSAYCGWKSYNNAKNNPRTAPFASSFGISGALTTLIYAAPVLATAVTVSKFAAKHLPEPNGKVDALIHSMASEVIGGLASLMLIEILGTPWARVSCRAGNIIAVLLTLQN